MLTRPMMRISRSSIAAILFSSSFMPAGLRNGMTPSMMHTIASAANKSLQSNPTTYPRGISAPAGAVQVLEEIALRRYDQNIALEPQGILVGLHAAIEGGEFWIAGIGARIGRGSTRISLAAYVLRLAGCIGQNVGALALGIGADLLGVSRAAGAQLLRLCDLALLHALVHGRGNIVSQVDALQLQVDQLDAKLPGGRGDVVERGVAQGAAHIGDHFAERLSGNRGLEFVAHDVGQVQSGHIRIAAAGLHETRGVEQLPFDVEIHAQRFLVTGQEALPGIGSSQNAAIENMLLIQRGFEAQSRTVLCSVHPAEA